MRKILLAAFLTAVLAGMSFAQNTIWEKSQAAGNYPAYLGTGNTERGFAYGMVVDKYLSTMLEISQNNGNYPAYLGTGSTERGFAYGVVDGTPRVYIVSRLTATEVAIIDQDTGDKLGVLDATGVTGGTFGLNDVEVSESGEIYAANLVVDASASPFKVYRWDNESAAPSTVIEYTGTGRIGDKFTVTGSADDNTLTVWAAVSSTDKVIKFTTTDNGATFTSEEITLSDGNLGSSAAVYPKTGTDRFFANSNGKGVALYEADGTLVSSIPTTVIGTGSNALRYFEAEGKEYMAVFDYITERALVADITAGLENAVVVEATPELGLVSNGNGTGDVDIIDDGTEIHLAVFATNNGFGLYNFNPNALGLTERVYVISRLDGTEALIIDAATGDELGNLSVEGVEGGLFLLNDAEVSDDGLIFAANMTLDASANAFKVYKWEDESSDPVAVIEYTGLALRFGDKFTVSGSSLDNSLTVWAVGSASDKVVKFTTADNGATFTPEVISLSDGNQGSSPVAVPRTGTDQFYVNSNGQGVALYNADGTFVEEIPTEVVGSGSNALRSFSLAGQEYLAIFDFITERALLANVTNGLQNATIEGSTPTLGTVANGNGLGDVDYLALGENEAKIAVFATNNGLGLYEFMPLVSAPEFDPAAGSYDEPVTVTITSATPDASIYYTLDGTDPSDQSTLYTEPFTLEETTTVKAIAYKEGMITSAISEAVYEIVTTLTVEAPVFAPAPGQYLDTVTVAMTSETEDALIYYTTDESDPSDQSTLYTEPILLNSSTTLKAIAYKEGMNPSEITSGYYEILTFPTPDTLLTHWELTTQAETMPEWFSTANYERGMAYGRVDGKDRVYVVTRLGAHRVIVLDALTGAQVGTLPKPPAAEGIGLFHLNDVAVSEDGIIFVDNMTLGADATHPFRVYRYDSEQDTGYTVISYDGELGRMGDMFNVSGRADDNTLTIWAAVASTGKIVKFTTADNGMTFTPEVIEVAGMTTNFQPNVVPMEDGSFYLKSYAKPLIHVSADGATIDTVSTFVVGTGSSRIRKATLPNVGEVLAVYYPDIPGEGGKEYASLVDISDGPENAVVIDVTPSIGSTANGNGAGAVDVWNYNDETYVVFVMGTNNGIAAFSNIEIAPVSEDVMGLVHTPGDLKAEIFNNGFIGYNIDSDGTGIVWKDQNGLWSGGFLFGSATRGKANGLAPSWASSSIPFENDIVNVTSNFAAGFQTNADFDQVTSALLNDEAATNPYGVEISQESYSNTGDEVVYLKYTFTNRTAEAIEDFYAGIFIDWDVDANTYETNMGAINEDMHLVYLYDQNTPYYYGIAAINGLDGANIITGSPGDEDEARTWAFEGISTIDQVEFTTPADYRVLQGTSLGTINAGESKEVVFAIVAGDDLVNLKENTEEAFNIARDLGWTEIQVGVEQALAGIPTDYELYQNYPNPFNPSTVIRYALPSASNVKVKIYNILGETVSELLNATQNAGYYNLTWNASHVASGVYFYSIEAKSTDGSKDFHIVKKMMLLK